MRGINERWNGLAYIQGRDLDNGYGKLSTKGGGWMRWVMEFINADEVWSAFFW
jgi:hypothetical protein